MNLKEKLQAIAAKQKAMLDAAGDAVLNEEQAKEFDDLDAEFGKLKGMLERQEKAAASAAFLDAPEPTVTGGVSGGEIARPGGPEAVREFECIGEFFHAARFKRNDQRLETGESQEHGMGFKVPAAFMGDLRGAHTMNDGPSGGYMVPKQTSGELLRAETAPAAVRPRARVIPAGTPPDAEFSIGALNQTAEQNMYGGVAVTWIGEGDSKVDTSAKIDEITLKPHEVAATSVVTDKLLRNWSAAGAFISDLLRGAMSAAEDDKFINGDGVGKPLGLIGSPAELTVARATTLRIKYADLVGMEEILLAGANPVWLTTRKGVGQCRRLEDTEGRLIWGQGNANDGTPSTLLGYPVVIVPRMPALGTKGDIVLTDLSHYLIKDGSGPFVSMSEHVLFQTNKTMIKAFWNVDGQPWAKAPFSQENGETQSAFIVLDVP